MMTSSQAERLARKITDFLRQPGSEASAAKLADDYSEVCRAASRRLEQCALMIEAGQSLQALQLAETPPSLLDLIAVLNFRDAVAWRNYCQSHQLPWSEPFYDKAVRALNNAYGSGAASDHPYYRDYRRAVLRKDDTRALSILRVIAKLNPADANTSAELKRVEEKLLRAKLERLRDALTAGDPAAMTAQIVEIEHSGASVPASNPVWQQAQIARCQELLRQAADFKEREAWQDAEILVDEIHGIATRHGIQLPQSDADAWSAIEKWTSAHRTTYAEDQDFQRALVALEYEVQTLDSKRAKFSRFSAEEAAALLQTLLSRREGLVRLNRPFDEALLNDSQQIEIWLRGQIAAARRKRQIWTGLAVLLVLGIIAALIPSALAWMEEKRLVHEMEAAAKTRHVSELQRLTTGIPAEQASRPAVAAAQAQAASVLEQEKALKRTFDTRMAALQLLAENKFQAALSQVGPDRLQAEQALAPLAPEYQPPGKSQLNAWDAKWQAFRNAALDRALQNGERLAASLKGELGVEGVNTTLDQIQSALAAMSPLKLEPPALAPKLESRYHDIASKATTWAGTIGSWKQAQVSLASAQSLEEFSQRRDQLVQSPFATTAQRDAVTDSAHLKITPQALLGELLAPNDRTLWDSLTNAASWPSTLMPEQPTAAEKDLYFKLRDDKFMKNVYVYELITNRRANNPFHSHLIYALGAIAPDRGGQMAGAVYDPEQYHDSARFLSQTYSDWDYVNIVRTNLTAESEGFDRLGLGDLIDPNTGHYQKPILQLFDQIARDDMTSGIFRAYVTMRLFDLARLRPREWGLPWCPAAARHLQALKELGTQDLKSGDWMAPVTVAKYETPLRRYFETARALSMEKQAAFLVSLAQQSIQLDFSYAGYADEQGHPIVRRLNTPAAELWGWSTTAQTAALLFKRTANGEWDAVAPAQPFSPLFIFNGDRRAVLQDVSASAGYPASQMQGILPPLYQGL